MSLIFHKTHISSSSTALASVLKTYEEYRDKIQYPENDKELFDRATDNIALLSGGITRVTVAVETLQAKVDKMEEQFNNTKKTDQKEMLLDIQEIEKDTQVFKLLAEAETFTHILEAQLTDARMNLAKAQRRQKSCSASSTQEGSAQSLAESNSARTEDNPNTEPTRISKTDSTQSYVYAELWQWPGFETLTAATGIKNLSS
ncbi:unnamed protein product [Cylicocyclus nassatus]|uniref:Uncharacterized protein n=1 Tax=Cylicocyclus nassatus TaxID=53992 RepID=A0AA36M832_CYLNA|nr:unnamed protein product [Cylicocyclus nassatus]